MKTDSGKVLRRKVEKNAERQVKRTWTCIEGTEWEEGELLEVGLLASGEKEQCAFCERIKGSTGGALRCIAIWGLSKLLARAEGSVYTATLIGALGAPLVWQLEDNCIVLWLARLIAACSTITRVGSFNIFLSSSRLETRIKESCSMKSMLVANQTMRNESEYFGWRALLKRRLHIQREFDFFEDSQQNSYC